MNKFYSKFRNMFKSKLFLGIAMLSFTLALFVSFKAPQEMNALSIVNSVDSDIILRKAKQFNGTFGIYTNMKPLSNGGVGYCMDSRKPHPPNGVELVLTNDTMPKEVLNAMKNGYPNRRWYSGDPYLDTYITQTVIWGIQDGFNESDIGQFYRAPDCSAKYKSLDIEPLKNHMINYMREIKNIQDPARPTVGLSTGGINAYESNGKMVTDWITVNGKQLNGSVNIQVSGAPAGTVVKNESGQVTNNINVGGRFYVEFPLQSNTSSFTIRGKATGTVEETRVYTTNNPQWQRIASYAPAPVDYDLYTGDCRVNFESSDGNLQIFKRDADSGVRLPGAQFRVTGPNGYNQTFTTDGNGSIWIGNLKTGDYTVTELKAPAGYVAVSGSKNITVSPGGNANVTFDNRKNKGTLEVIKQGADGRKLQGAVFRVTRKSDGAHMGDMTTDGNGIARMGNLLQGTYVVTETTPPTGYILSGNSTQEVSFFINADDTTTNKSVTFTNDRVKATVRLLKKDSETKKALPGAEFTITGPEGYNVTKATDSRGVVLLENVIYGDYTIEEIKAPEGYLKGGPWNFNIRENGSVVVVELENTPIRGDIKLYKTDEDSGNPVQGAEFRITGPNGYDVTQTTNENGEILIENVLFGNYHVVETKPAEAYLPADKEWDIKVERNGEIHELHVTNKPITADLKIIKTNDDGSKLLPGAKFNIKSMQLPNQQGIKPYLQNVVTDENGEINLTGLRYGRYEITEMQSPEGYLVNTRPVQFYVDGTKSVYSFNITNELILGDLEILKTDKDTGEPLLNAIFRIQGITDPNFRQDIDTKVNGVARFENLPYGKYTVQEIKAPTGYVMDARVFEIDLHTKGQVIRIEHTNKINEGKIEVDKLDNENGDKLANARFEVYDLNGVKTNTLVTDQNGKATTGLLRYGNYTMREVKSPVGYLPNDNTYKIFVEEEGKTYVTPVENQVIKGKIKVIKTDGLDKYIRVPGVEFSVWKKGQDTLTEEPVCKIVTDENGEALTPDLRYGEYVIKETNTVEEYYLNEGEWQVFIKDNDHEYFVNVVNEPVITKVKLTKTSDQTNKRLANAKFQIWNVDKNEVVTFTERDEQGRPIPTTTFTTDKNGVFSIPEVLRYGNYKIVEVEPPTGFLAIEDIHFSVNKETPFIDKDGEMWLEFEATDVIIRGDVELTKTSKDTGAIMPKVTFELVRVTNPEDHELGKVGEYTTNSEGKILVESLPYGEYYFKEIETLEGYVLDETPIPFMIQEDKVKLEFGMDNKWIRGDGKLTKTDIDTNDLIPGVVFELYKYNGREFSLISEHTTNEKGEILIKDLPYGKYQLREVKTLENYVLDGKPVEFFIQEDGKEISLGMTNEKKKGDLEISKSDVATGKPLPDAGFTIWSSDKKTEIVKGITDENGKAYFKELPYGKYYYQEYGAPEGYVIDESLFPFEIKDDGEVIKANMTNEMIKGTLELNKIDISTGELIPNAKFAISENLGTTEEPKKGDIVKKGITDEKGLFRIEDLKYGKYVYEEIEAPEGYILNDALMPFEIKENGSIIKSEVPNEKIRGTIDILKVDNKTKEPLEGAYFEVYNKEDKEGKTPLFKGSSDDKGKLVFENVEYGEYYVKELRAPQGYTLDNKAEKVNIKFNKDIINITFENDKVQLAKTGSVLTYGIVGLGVSGIGGLTLVRRKLKRK